MDSTTKKEDNSYVIVQVKKCHEDNRNDDDPDCAPIEGAGGINEWIKTKIIKFDVLDNSIDFDENNEWAV